ncbi:coat protein [Dregea volubilis virus 1]|nr:coat protein [Dregea volubilis virus 1]
MAAAPIDKDTTGPALIVSSFTIHDERVLDGGDKIELLGSFEKKLKDKLKCEDNELKFHLGSILSGYAVRNTCQVTNNKGGDFLDYTVNTKRYTLNEKEAYSLIAELPKLFNVGNRVRVFCRTFSKEYLEFYRQYASILPFHTRSIKLGLPAKFHYLQADFLADTTLLTTDEQQALVFAKDIALKKSKPEHGVTVTNLYELGKVHRN